MLNEALTIKQWRKLFEVLCDGDPRAAFPLTFMRQFKDAIAMYFWLRRNRVQGAALVDFFDEKGNLGAVQFIRDRIEGRKFTTEPVTIKELN